MSGAFPGAIFDGEGTPMDGRRAVLSQDRIDACSHRSMVTRESLAPVAWVWLLDDDATFSAVPQGVVDGAVKLVMSDWSILILGHLAEPVADVRDALLSVLELAQAPDIAAGHA